MYSYLPLSDLSVNILDLYMNIDLSVNLICSHRSDMLTARSDILTAGSDIFTNMSMFTDKYDIFKDRSYIFTYRSDMLTARSDMFTHRPNILYCVICYFSLILKDKS
jgi:hypothetical protein